MDLGRYSALWCTGKITIFVQYRPEISTVAHDFSLRGNMENIPYRWKGKMH